MEDIGDYIYMIPNTTSLPSFTKLYDVPIGLIILLAIAYGTVSLCAIIGNGIVLWVVVRSHRMRTVTNIFLANLAFADMLIGALSIPFQFQSALLQRWLLPDFMCPFCPFINVISVNASIFTLTAIAIDRYRIVVNPLWPRLTKLRAQLIIIAIWIVAVITGVPILLAMGVAIIPDDVAISKMNLTNLNIQFTNKTDSNNNNNYLVLPSKPFCYNIGISQDLLKLYNRFLVVIQYFLPVFLISWAYGRMAYTLYIESINKRENRNHIVYKLRRIDAINHRNRNPRNQSPNRNDIYINREKRKVLKLLVIIVALFALFWLPLQTYNAISDIFPQINEYEYINIIWFCCHWLAMSNSGVNPFVYAIYNLRS